MLITPEVVADISRRRLERLGIFLPRSIIEAITGDVFDYLSTGPFEKALQSLGDFRARVMREEGRGHTSKREPTGYWATVYTAALARKKKSNSRSMVVGRRRASTLLDQDELASLMATHRQLRARISRSSSEASRKDLEVLCRAIKKAMDGLAR